MATKERSVCQTCGKEFGYYRSTLRGKTGKFCSRKCIKVSAWNKGMIEYHECIGCGAKTRKWLKYCSEACFRKHSNPKLNLPKKMVGENNPAWKGGVTPLTRLERNKFGKTIARTVLERDNYTCQMCGERGGRLHVDHIQPWSEYVEGRFDIKNCRTLCLDCHYLVTWGKPRPQNSTWGTHKYFDFERI